MTSLFSSLVVAWVMVPSGVVVVRVGIRALPPSLGSEVM